MSLVLAMRMAMVQKLASEQCRDKHSDAGRAIARGWWWMKFPTSVCLRWDLMHSSRSASDCRSCSDHRDHRSRPPARSRGLHRCTHRALSDVENTSLSVYSLYATDVAREGQRGQQPPQDAQNHWRRSLVNFSAAWHFCPKNMYEKLTKCPNFTWILHLAQKLSKYPNLNDICPKNEENSISLHGFCPKMPEFYIKFPPKKFFRFFFWGGEGKHVPPAPRLPRLCQKYMFNKNTQNVFIFLPRAFLGRLTVAIHGKGVLQEKWPLPKQIPDYAYAVRWVLPSATFQF